MASRRAALYYVSNLEWQKCSIRRGGGGAPVGYNTVQILKEAEEDLDDLQEEGENVVVAEEKAFEQSRLELEREKLERHGAVEHTEVLRYDNAKSALRLIGVIQKRAIGNSTDGMQNRQLIPPTKGTGKCEKDVDHDRRFGTRRARTSPERVEAMRSCRPTPQVKKA